MDRAAIQELSDFTDFAWRQVADLIREAGDGVVARPAPGSGWPALRDCLGHILFAYDRWLPGVAGSTVRPLITDTDAVRTWAQIQAYRAQVREKVQSLLDGFSDDELYAARDVEIDGETLRYSRADLLAHLLLHECRHHGDVSTLFYQLGIEFAAIEYRFYLLERG